MGQDLGTKRQARQGCSRGVPAELWGRTGQPLVSEGSSPCPHHVSLCKCPEAALDSRRHAPETAYAVCVIWLIQAVLLFAFPTWFKSQMPARKDPGGGRRAWANPDSAPDWPQTTACQSSAGLDSSS